MSVLITADIHQTDRPVDEYRWKLFPWLCEQAKKHNVDEILILGDLTDAKDRHPARLVNRLMTSASSLAEVAYTVFLKGNHDYYDPSNPFFEFMKFAPNMDFIKTPEVKDLSIGKCCFIPAGENWKQFKLLQLPYTFTHVTFDGSESENGTLLPGVDPAIAKGYEGKIYSGDIHVPQKIRKNVEYVGAPYHCRFGDTFTPRVLLIHNDGSSEDLRFPAPRKHTIEIDKIDALNKAKFKPGDHVKVRFYLRRTEYDEWRKTRDAIKEIVIEREGILFGIEPIAIEIKEAKKTSEVDFMSSEQLVEAYCKNHRIPSNYMKIGKDLLREI
jgi:hypothetical protein